MDALSWVLALQSLQLLRAKIALLQPLPPLSRRYAMPQENPRSFIAAKEISVSVLLLLNDFQVYATLSLLEHR
jgi:hypothetical protein